MNPDQLGPEDDLGPAQAGSSGPVDDGLGPTAAEPPREPDMSAAKDYITKNLAGFKPSETQGPSKTYAETFSQALLAGLQSSSTGLLVHGAPTTIMPEHAGRAMRIASMAGQYLGDVPEFITGGVGGFIAGAGNPAAVAAGAFAVPMGLRKILMDHYEKGDIKDAGEFIDRALGASWESIKGAATGAVTALTGGAAAPVIGTVGAAAAELGAMTTVGAALEGHLPTFDEFVDGAILLGGLHGVQHIVPKLRNIYAKTGDRPADVYDAASKDVQLKQDLVSPDPNLPKIAEPTDLTHTEEVPATDGKGAQAAKTELVAKPIPEPEIRGLPRTEAEKEILSKIGVSETPPKTSAGDKFDAWYARNIDYLDPLNAALSEAKGNGAEILPENDPYQMGRRFAANSDTVRSMLEFGTRDAKTNEINGEGLNQIYRDIPNQDLDGYRAYGIAKRALELNERGITPYEGFSKETAEKVVADGAEKYESINRRRIEFQNRILDFARDKGLFSEEAVDSMKELNKEHFPFNRIQDADLYTGKVKGGSAVKRIFGSEKELLDPVLQTFKNTEMIVRKSMINDVRNKFVEAMNQGGLLDTESERKEEAYLTRVEKGMRPIEVQSEEISRALEKQGLSMPFEKFAREMKKKLPNATEEQIRKAYDQESPQVISPEAFVIFRPEKTFLKDNQIAIWQNGKPQIFEGPPGVIDSLRRMEGDFTAIDTWSKVMRGFANATRVGVIANPGFGFSHFFRSQIMSSVYSKTGMFPFVESASVMKELMGASSKDYQDWLYHGGASSSWFRIEENYLKDNAIEKDEREAPIHGRAWNAVHSAMDATEAFIKLTDNASRFAEYKRSVERGVSPQEAAFRSREVVPDYQKVGLERSALRTGVAFIGAHINSLDRMVKAFKDDPKSTVAKLSAITAISAMLWAANKDDPAIEALPDWQKDQYWNFNLSRMGGGKKGEPATILRLPKPWAPGVLFGSGVEVALDGFYKDNPKRMDHFFETFKNSIVPEPIPNIAQPILEQWANKNKFTGRALVREDMEKQLPEMQYAPYTSEAAKQIAKLIGYVPWVKDVGPKGVNVTLSSPLVVENYIHAWGGTAGGWALNIADRMIRQEQRNAIEKSKIPVAEKEAKIRELYADKATPWQNTPIVHSFVSRYPSFNDQNIQDFYENKAETDRVMNSIHSAAKKGDIQAAQAIMDANPGMLTKLDGISKAITTARKTYQIIQDDPKMPAVEKRQLLDTQLFQMSEMAKYGNKMISDFKKQGHATMTQGE